MEKGNRESRYDKHAHQLAGSNLAYLATEFMEQYLSYQQTIINEFK